MLFYFQISEISEGNLLDAVASIIRDIDILPVDNLKNLGIHMDNKLSFAHHVKNVSSKISRSCGVIVKLTYFVPNDVI
jgi:hypothetical protein